MAHVTHPRSTPRGVSLLALVATLLVVTSCTPDPPPQPVTSSSEFGVLGAEGCAPPSPFVDSEVQGTASAGVTAYGLIFSNTPSALPADGTTVKLVVRMTGKGPFSAHLTAPDGTERALDWGPELHGGSTFHRPGAEWGTGFSFDRPGCWQLNLERGKTDRATFWLTAAD